VDRAVGHLGVDLHVVEGVTQAQLIPPGTSATARSSPDDSVFRKDFGPVEVTPHAEAVAATLNWYRHR
jgi:hypothetical protein